MYQHGDVLIKKITELPEGLTIKAENDVIVAEGEATGHHHRVTGKVQLMERTENHTLFLNVLFPATITHQEHKPIDLPVGIYEIGRVREYDYLKEMERRVID